MTAPNFMEQLSEKMENKPTPTHSYPWQYLTAYPCLPASFFFYDPFFAAEMKNAEGEWEIVWAYPSWKDAAQERNRLLRNGKEARVYDRSNTRWSREALQSSLKPPKLFFDEDGQPIAWLPDHWDEAQVEEWQYSRYLAQESKVKKRVPYGA